MAVIEKEIKLVGSKGEETVNAIFDSGASYSCIQPQLAKDLAIVEPLPEAMDFGTAKEGERLTATEAIRLNFYLDGYRFSDEFMLIDSLSEPVLIGAATMQKWRLKLNFETDEVIIDPRVTKLRLLRFLPVLRLLRNVVRGFSLVLHNPKGSHYKVLGAEISCIIKTRAN